MKKGRSNPVPPEIQAEIDALAALPEDQIKTDDIPEVRDWNGAKRGLFYRPIKQQITLRLDADLIDWFKNHHPQDEGYQTSINRALREYVAQREG
ncbi:MAG: BrnA antitoxin family protein [Thermosynechococcaceae cyanobacterium]